MGNELSFSTRQAFRTWLEVHSQTHEGIWLIFEKGVSLSAHEALEEALCFGWIDGVMKHMDGNKYKKYFSRRVKNSKWSEKNKALVLELEKNRMLTPHGLFAIEEAKQNGKWEMSKKDEITEENILEFCKLITINQQALNNYNHMSYSVRKTYVLFYQDAKTDVTKKSRLEKIINRLEQNLKPM